MTKSVAVKEKENLPAAIDADFMAEMAGDAGMGTESITSADVAIPFIRIAQKMSPVVSKRDSEYIPGCEEGHIYNTVSKQLYDGEEGILVIPCGFNFKYIEWKPRDSGGGIVDTYSRNGFVPDTIKNDKGQDITHAGNILAPTAEHYVMVLNKDGSIDQALLSLSSTSLKVSKRWNALVKQQTLETPKGPVPAPLFSRMYRLKTVVESNDQGEWCNFSVSCEGPVEKIELYRAAKAFSNSILQGEVIVKHEQDLGEEIDDIPM